MHSADTELDRQVLELVTHLVRNCALEAGLISESESRPRHRESAAAKRSEQAAPRYHSPERASRQGGHVVIEIADDGRGLDTARNVLIYFDQDTKIGVLHRLAEAMSSDGYFVLGVAETVIGLSDRFQIRSDKPGLYPVRSATARLVAQHRTTHARPRLVAISGGR